MGEVSYRPLIEDMIWSYSRISTFDDCPYRWFLKYIKGCTEVEKFYSSYGSFMHKLIERYYKGELTKNEMPMIFLNEFSERVKGIRPQENIVKKYIQCGSDYLKDFKPFKYKMIDVEKRVDFELDGISFVGYIDYLGEKDGEYYIIDNKSRNLKPRSNRLKPTLKDYELDLMLKQLYIYSAAIKQEYGRFPKGLCFNCFRTGNFIEEPFSENAYNMTIEWAKKKIEEIKNADEFHPKIEFFSCNYICGVSDDCCYNQNERRSKV